MYMEKARIPPGGLPNRGVTTLVQMNRFSALCRWRWKVGRFIGCSVAIKGEREGGRAYVLREQFRPRTSDRVDWIPVQICVYGVIHQPTIPFSSDCAAVI